MTGDVGHGARGDDTLPLAPSAAPAIDSLGEGEPRLPGTYEPADRRSLVVAGLAVLLAVAAGLVAQLLVALIALVTNLAFFGRLSTAHVAPGATPFGWAAILGVPIVGALVVGVMARYGSTAIRGHGIPEVMEKVLHGESRIPGRVMFLKPLSAAVAIGTGGPFGAEGPIIATGGALGSLVGQLLRVTADERKTLLACGAAAGMAATFGSPVSAVLLAVELLLFEYRPRSLIPVALASAVATAVRTAFEGTAPVFPIPAFAAPSGPALAVYTLLGALLGAVAVGVTRLTYGIEDRFEHLGARFRIHWMWWPAIGAVAVGGIGLLEPRTLGVGYVNITDALAGTVTGRALLVLVVLKLLSWAIYLGSGTSGGTLAPLFTIGGGLGAWLGAGIAALAPTLGVSTTAAGLVGMAAIFAGASHALLASVVFAFETTREPMGLLPLLAGCSAAYLASLLLGRHSIMTTKLARRGSDVRTEYAADYLSQQLVREAASHPVVMLAADEPLGSVRARLAGAGAGASHQGFPVIDAGARLVGVVTRRDLFDAAHGPDELVGATVRRPPVVVFGDSTLRDAADHMVLEQVGRLPVVDRENPRRVVGIITRSDLLAAHAPRLRASRNRATPRWAGDVPEAPRR